MNMKFVVLSLVAAVIAVSSTFPTDDIEAIVPENSRLLQDTGGPAETPDTTTDGASGADQLSSVNHIAEDAVDEGAGQASSPQSALLAMQGSKEKKKKAKKKAKKAEKKAKKAAKKEKKTKQKEKKKEKKTKKEKKEEEKTKRKEKQAAKNLGEEEEGEGRGGGREC